MRAVVRVRVVGGRSDLSRAHDAHVLWQLFQYGYDFHVVETQQAASVDLWGYKGSADESIGISRILL